VILCQLVPEAAKLICPSAKGSRSPRLPCEFRFNESVLSCALSSAFPQWHMSRCPHLLYLYLFKEYFICLLYIPSLFVQYNVHIFRFYLLIITSFIFKYVFWWHLYSSSYTVIILYQWQALTNTAMEFWVQWTVEVVMNYRKIVVSTTKSALCKSLLIH
jgi:hypothetical protein